MFVFILGFYLWCSDVWINIIKYFFPDSSHIILTGIRQRGDQWPQEADDGGDQAHHSHRSQLHDGNHTVGWYFNLNLNIHTPYTFILQGEIMILDIDN